MTDTTPQVFIVESLKLDDEKNERFEGRVLQHILRLGGKKSAYYYIRTRRELEKMAPHWGERGTAEKGHYVDYPLLRVYGFVQMQVTAVGADGGIDGHGKLRLGLASMNVAYQCKQWQQNVGRPEVDKFRGAIQGEYEQGVFFATSDFTAQARDASLKKGAVPITLLNGESIVDLMIEKQLGVSRTPLYVYEERPDELVGEVEE